MAFIVRLNATCGYYTLITAEQTCIPSTTNPRLTAKQVQPAPAQNLTSFSSSSSSTTLTNSPRWRGGSIPPIFSVNSCDCCVCHIHFISCFLLAAFITLLNIDIFHLLCHSLFVKHRVLISCFRSFITSCILNWSMVLAWHFLCYLSKWSIQIMPFGWHSNTIIWFKLFFYNQFKPYYFFNCNKFFPMKS
jgi:hypothetical protein